MEQSRLMGPGYFYEIVFNRKKDPWMIDNRTIMYFPGEIPPTTSRIFDEAKRKLSEVCDQEINVSHFDLIKARTTFLV